MPSLKELTASKYLSKEDVGPGMLFTIAGCDSVEMQGNGQKESNFCLTFNETPKMLVLKTTNRDLLLGIYPLQQHTNEWIGRQVVLFNDQSVLFRGERGGIRVRAPRINPNAMQGSAGGDQPAYRPQPLPFQHNGQQGRMEAEDIHGRTPIPAAGVAFGGAGTGGSGSQTGIDGPFAPPPASQDGLPF